jgi:antitoxin VapB
LRPRWLAPALRPRLVATIDQHLGNVVYINGIYHGKWTMSATAKLFMHGRSQAVRLPKEFRFEGSEVRVSKVGDKVILEPLKKQPFDTEAWFARLDELGARDFLPDGIPEDPPLEPDPRIFFDK